MESASVSSRGVNVAEREAQNAREGASRLEAEVKRLSSHLADLNSSYRSLLLRLNHQVAPMCCPTYPGLGRPPDAVHLQPYAKRQLGMYRRCQLTRCM